MEIVELYLLGLAGVLLHFLKELQSSLSKNKSMNWKIEGVSHFSSILITMIIVYARDEIASFYPIGILTAVVTGYAAQSVFAYFIELKKPKGAGTIITVADDSGEGPDPDKEEK